MLLPSTLFEARSQNAAEPAPPSRTASSLGFPWRRRRKLKSWRQILAHGEDDPHFGEQRNRVSRSPLLERFCTSSGPAPLAHGADSIVAARCSARRAAAVMPPAPRRSPPPPLTRSAQARRRRGRSRRPPSAMMTCTGVRGNPARRPAEQREQRRARVQRHPELGSPSLKLPLLFGPVRAVSGLRAYRRGV